MNRVIAGIFAAPGFHWVGDGFRVAGYFSAIPDVIEKMSPFLLLDYGPEHVFKPTTQKRGVGSHPHRGFETVTIAFQGSVTHRDSTGSGGTIGPGDVQWMTAAAGILHEEFHAEDFARRGGAFQMAQIWVNLPKANKMDTPHYQPIAAKDIAEAKLPNDAGVVRVIAGEYGGVKGPAKTYTPIALFDVRLSAKGRAELSIPARDNLGILVMKGDVTLNGRAARANEFVLFENEGERIAIDATSEAQLLVLSGQPIEEPVVQYGPFVMNTEREIREAIVDFNSGKFGDL